MQGAHRRSREVDGGAGRRARSRSSATSPCATKGEILHLACHQEEQEKPEHPLHRIMAIDEQGDAIVVRTTDIHLPRRIGEALQHAYHGELDFRYEEETYFLRVHWTRDG